MNSRANSTFRRSLASPEPTFNQEAIAARRRRVMLDLHTT
jgi:hypothetical protein